MTNSSQLSQQGNLSSVNGQPQVPWNQLSMIVVMIFGTVGKALCCFAVVRFKFLRTVPNYFITSLAVSDLYTCSVVMPLSVYTSFNQHLWYLGNTLCYIWFMSQFVTLVSSILTLGAISTDRLLSIVKPVSYSKVRKRFAICTIVGVGLISGMVFVIFSDTQLLINNRCGHNPRDGASKIVVCFIIFWIPLFAVIAINLGIAKVTCQLKRIIKGPVRSNKISPEAVPTHTQKKTTVTTVSKSNTVGHPGCSHWGAPSSINPIPPSYELDLDQTRPNTIKGTSAAKKNKLLNRQQDDALTASKRRSYIVVTVVILSFTLFWLPFFFMTVHSVVCPECYQTPTAAFFLAESRWLGYLNSTINPVIYALIKRDYRRALKLLVKRRPA
ncbi:5-hydroxytryptamine receptor 2C-like [Asterias amurensis]|uniref:5-hydroxytryptamine receptor 2C-like n=1 Tax=Asterias amurensis TaxID=7602 RepID=UPI003AB8C361